MHREHWTLGSEKREYIGDTGFYMRLNSNIKKCVLLLGVPDYTSATEIKIEGTGFLLNYDGHQYLVTARHVAFPLEDNCSIRVNTTDGKSTNILVDRLPWEYHPDRTVDLAAVPFCIKNFMPHRGGPDIRLIDESIIVTDKMLFDGDTVELGDICYTVGLFHVLSGEKRNLPVIHTGNLARKSGEERIPIQDPTSLTRRVLADAHLVETQSLNGLSGSPVLVRKALRFGMRAKAMNTKGRIQESDFPKEIKPDEKLDALDLIAYTNDVYLLGVFVAAWDFPAGEVIAIDRGQPITVPVGMGVVVPASKIIELLEGPKLKSHREDSKRRHALATAATPRSVGGSRVAPAPASDVNPTHQEDFKNLLIKAAKTQPQDD